MVLHLCFEVHILAWLRNSAELKEKLNENRERYLKAFRLPYMSSFHNAFTSGYFSKATDTYHTKSLRNHREKKKY